MKKSILAAFALLVGVNLQAQDTKCGSTEQDVLEQYKNQPELLEKYLKSKEDFQRYMIARESKPLSNAKTVQAEDSKVRTIPVVFHILHQDGDENISYEQIADQMRVLNEDFMRLNPDAANTPEAFQYRADINSFSIDADDIVAFAAPNKYLQFQAAPTITEDVEYNVPTGTKYIVYFKNGEDFQNPPILQPADGEEIKYLGVDVEGLGNRYYLAKEIIQVLNDSASAEMDIFDETDAVMEKTSIVFNAGDLANYGDSTGFITLTDIVGAETYISLSDNADPLGAGTEVLVDISSAANNTDVAVAVSNAIDALDNFSASTVGTTVVVEGLYGEQADITVGDVLSPLVSLTVLDQGVVNSATIRVENDAVGVANSMTVGLSAAQVNYMEVDRGWKYASSARIQFQLARIDPNGHSTNGINRIYSERTNQANPDNGQMPEGGYFYNKWRSIGKNIIQWNPEKYLNVWVADKLVDPLNGGLLLGFAQFPNELAFQPKTDGIMVRADNIGSIENVSSGNTGRTLTHEIGHWLGLRHIWGDEDECEADDGVSDTPQQKANHSGECPTYPETEDACIDDGYGTMFMNYMDYSTDVCMNMFTFGQGEVMRGAMEMFRSDLWSDANLLETGTADDFDESSLLPYADFSYSNRWICAGGNVDFRQEAFYTDGSTTYSWEFPGSEDGSSSSQNPNNIDYDVPGHYDVSLIVTNANGSDTVTMKNFIHVSPSSAEVDAGSEGVYAQFDNWVEVHGDEANSFSVVPQDDATWRYVDLAGSTSDSHKGAVKIGSYQTSELITHTMMSPVMNLDDLSGTGWKMNLDVAYANRETRTDDRLIIYYRTNCNTSWKRLFYMSNRPSPDNSVVEDELTVRTDTFIYNNYWVPAEDDWKTFSRTLSSPQLKEETQFRFDFIGTKGNFLYIDNFYITKEDPSVGIDELSFENSIELFPNPSEGNVTLSFDLAQDENVKIEVVDILGKTYGVAENTYNAGNNKVELDEVTSGLTSGVYFARVYRNGQVFTNKFVISK